MKRSYVHVIDELYLRGTVVRQDLEHRGFAVALTCPQSITLTEALAGALHKVSPVPPRFVVLGGSPVFVRALAPLVRAWSVPWTVYSHLPPGSGLPWLQRPSFEKLVAKIEATQMGEKEPILRNQEESF